MKKIIKFLVIILVVSLTIACGNKKEEKVEDKKEDNKVKSELINNNIVPKTLSFDFNITGMTEKTLSFKSNDKSLKIPVPNYGSGIKIFGIYDAYNGYSGAPADYEFKWRMYDENGNTINVSGILYGPSKIDDGVDLNKFKPTFGDGGESYFYGKEYNAYFENVMINSETQFATASGQNLVQLISTSKLDNNTFNGYYMKFKYASKESYDSTVFKGYKEFFVVEQQLTDDLRIRLSISLNSSQTSRNIPVEIPTDIELQKIENTNAIEAYGKIIKMYGLEEQYAAVLNSTENFDTLFETNKYTTKN